MFFFCSMADKNILMPHQLNYCLLRQKITWNILGMEQLLKAKKKLLLALNMRKMLLLTITPYVSESNIFSENQEHHSFVFFTIHSTAQDHSGLLSECKWPKFSVSCSSINPLTINATFYLH